MKKYISVILIICISILLFAGCKSNDKSETNDNLANAAVNVTVYKASVNDINNNVNYIGEIIATEQSEVSSKISSTITSINYDIGDYVSAGSVLAVLDDTDYKLSYNQALASYNNALASYNSVTNGTQKQSKSQLETAVTSAQLEYDNAMDNYNRQKALYDVGAISLVALESAEIRLESAKIALDSAKSNYDITVNEINKDSAVAAQAAVDAAKSALDIAQNSLNNTRVVAPISGYIASRNGNIGQMAVAGNPMFSIKNSSEVNVEISVTESIIPFITTSTKAMVNVETAKINNVEGVVSAINTVKDEKTGMYTVRIKINNANNLLKIGMMADVELQVETSNNALVIPNDAIMQEEDTYYVYV